MNREIERRILKLASGNLRSCSLLISKMAEEKGSKKKGPPKNWKSFWREKYEGGKKRVPNPNPKTKGRIKDVAASTALKDKKFQSYVMKEYKKWNKENKEEESDAKFSSSLRKTLTSQGKLDGFKKKS
jgi:hypothetical protein